MYTNEHAKQQDQKHPWLAVLLSKVFPGAGQIYAGARARGIFFILFTIVLSIIIVVSVYGFLMTESAQDARTDIFISLVAFFLLLVVSIYVLFDAYRVTKLLDRRDAPVVAAPGHRKPWLAAFLSSILPGIGQFYNKQLLKGFILLAADIVVHELEHAFAPFFIVSLFVVLFGIKDAFDSAETLNGSNQRFFQQEKAVVRFIVIMLALGTIPFAFLVRENIIEAFKIPSGAMRPTLQIGDHILTRKFRTLSTPVQRGDIVVFPYPEDPEKNFIKRVVGLEGDTVRITDGELYINDQMVPSKRVGEQSVEGQPSIDFGQLTTYEEQIGGATYRIQHLRDRITINGGPWQVPQGTVFVMGDNRDNSMDSRVYGAVAVNTLIAKAGKIYWSWDHEAGAVRWERIGETIR